MDHTANRNCKCALLTLVVMLFVITETASGQTTAFSYQGRLTDAGNPADGLFDMQFKLFDTATTGTGTQQGPDATNSAVQITKGIFSLMLDFGNVFDGSARFLEISLRPTGSPAARTVLSPRQPLASTPYALHSLTAATARQACRSPEARPILAVVLQSIASPPAVMESTLVSRLMIGLYLSLSKGFSM